jgi:hypothetical protein
MARGARSAYLLFDDPTPPAAPARKGRSADEIERRNEFLITRYYYWRMTEKKWAWEEYLEQLRLETFLSPITIAEIINDNQRIAASIKNQPPSITQLQKKWPHINWEIPKKK